MTINHRRGTAAENHDAWNRLEHILAGQRLYSNRKLAFWLAGKQPVQRLEKTAPESPLTPEAARAPWIPDKFLSDLVDGDDIAASGRYMSISERLRRLYGIAVHFTAIRDGRIVPTRYQHPKGTLVRMESDGPTAIWRAWAKAIWATLPAKDSDIFSRTANTQSPKNAHLAINLAMLLSWAKMRAPLSLDGTNWFQADNDNYDAEEQSARPASNLERRMRPGSTDAELLSFMKKAGPTTEWRHAKLGAGGTIELRPTNVDLQKVRDKATKSHSVVVRAGKLRIANGKTFEGGNRIEAGTILHQPDRFGELLGPEPNPAEKVRSASYWALLFKVDRNTVVETDEDGNEKPRFIKAGRMRRKVLFTAEDHAALLAGPLPEVTRYPDGLPCGAPTISDNFVGGWISNPKGKQPLERWEDISDEIARQQDFERWAAALPPEEAKALNLAATAANFKEVGEALGKEGKTAERYGKRILVAANDNLKKLTAA